MKSEWEFPFEARDLYFEREHHFVGTLSAGATADAPAIHDLDIGVRIVPDDAKPGPQHQQTGRLFVAVPLRPEDAEDIAYGAARSVAEQVSFRAGDFRVSFGYVACKRIPENEQEAAEIDGKPYSLRLHMREVVPPPVFDGGVFTEAAEEATSLPLMAQFNETKRLDTPIQRFLGFFRVLESVSYPAGLRAPIKTALRQNSSLRTHFEAIAPDKDFELFVDTIADLRHECAHLKLDAGFGLDPLNARVRDNVRPLLPMLEELAFRCIQAI